MTRSKLWGNRFMSRLISRLTGQRFHDVSRGMRCYRRRAALLLYLLALHVHTRGVLEPGLTRQVRMSDAGIRVRGERAFGRSRRVAHSLSRYAFRASVIILRSYRDYWPLHSLHGLRSQAGVARRHHAGLGRVLSRPLCQDRPVPPAHPATALRSARGASFGLAVLMMHIGLITGTCSTATGSTWSDTARQREGHSDRRARSRRAWPSDCVEVPAVWPQSRYAGLPPWP